jgi:hypothetical protein
MTATLAGVIDRVESLLMDSSNVVWDTATITEGIRTALGEYSAAGSAQIALSGLDGAAATTLPVVHETMIVMGGAAYSALTRAVNRSESFQQGSEAQDLKAWGENRLREFKAMLGFVFPNYLIALAGTAGGSFDPALAAAQAALASAQAAFAAAQAAAVTGQESRAAAAAAAATAAAAAEVERKRGLRSTSDAAWGRWKDEDG